MASLANVTRVAARCYLGGDSTLEHNPWKTMEQLHFAHWDGRVWEHLLSPGTHSEKRLHIQRGQPSCLGMEGRGAGGSYETHPGCLPSPRWGGERVVYCGFALTFQAGKLSQDEQVGTEGPASG